MSKSINLLWILLFSLIANAQNPQLKIIPYISGLVKPVDITNCNDSRLFIVEQDGRIRVVINNTLITTPFLNINTQVLSTGNAQGLLGLTFHPNYKNNGYFYVNYINNSGHTRISRFSVDPLDSNIALISSEVVLMTINQPYTNNNGGELLFGPDGYLYIFMGDGGNANDPQNRAQNPLEKLGKTLRIDVNNGSLFAIPPDNPFINNSNYLPEIWHTGLRQPWKACFDNVNDGLWISDVGQNIWEEINYQNISSTGGENYGWRCYEASAAFNLTGCLTPATYTIPGYEYAHTNGNCSVIGGEVYDGAKYANLFGRFLFSDFCVPTLRTLKKTGNQFTFSTHSTWQGAGISSFGKDWRGDLYASNLYNGQIVKITDTSSCIPVAWLSNTDSIQICGTSGKLRTPFGDSLTYSWYRNGLQLPGMTNNEITVNQNGIYVVSVAGPQVGCNNSDTVYVSLTGSITSLTLNGLDTNYCINDPTVTLIGTPSGGTFSGIGVNGNTFSPTQAGTGTILVLYKYTDNNGCTTKLIKSTKILTCSGINEYGTGYISSIFPNPTNEKLTLKLNNESKNDLRLRVFDQYGQLMFFDNSIINKNEQEYTLSTITYAQGIYLIELTDKQGSKTTKLFNVIH